MSEFVSETAKKAGDRDLAKFEVMQIHAEYWQWSDKEITALRQQLEQAEAKADLFRRACEDLLDDRPIEQAFILRKQAEAVGDIRKDLLSDLPDHPVSRQVAARLELRANSLREKAERAGGEK